MNSPVVRMARRLLSSRITNGEYGIRREQLLYQALRSTGRIDKPIVILQKGSRRSYIAPDVPHQFRQCSHFRYTTGLGSLPDCYYLTFYAQGRGKAKNILFHNPRTPHEELWEGKFPSEAELEQTARFDDIISPNQLGQILSKMYSTGCTLFVEESDWANHSAELEVIRSFPQRQSVNFFINQLRLIKSESELEAMQDVCSIGAQMMASSIYQSKGLHSESTLVGLLEFEARRRGAETLAYPPVIAGGNRANTIHYLEANRQLNAEDCVLVDAGCDLNGYVSDITRCWPVSGKFTTVQRELYEALRDVHEKLLEFAHISEKIKLSQIYSKMIELIAANMLEIGLIPKSDNARLILKKAEELCPHHVSHYLGMDVHDCPTVSRDIDLVSGVVFTVEPGVYVPLGSDFPVEFQGIGFRIEDDIVKTTEGIEVLSSLVPRSADELEYLLNYQ